MNEKWVILILLACWAAAFIILSGSIILIFAIRKINRMADEVVIRWAEASRRRKDALDEYIAAIIIALLIPITVYIAYIFSTYAK